jgi:urease accessory protein
MEATLEIIRHLWEGEDNPALPTVLLKVPRLNLRRRRWRGIAEDGVEFGFDLERPLADGAVIHISANSRYLLEQQPEPVLEISLPAPATEAARLGWMMGNLHFAIEVTPSLLSVEDDPAVRQLCEREQLPFRALERVFRPLSGGHSHKET